VKSAIAQMPNDAAAEKSGATEHGDDATVRCHHDSHSPVHLAESLTLNRLIAFGLAVAVGLALYLALIRTRFGGKAGIAEFTELRWITIETGPQHYPI
jgi:hypothetical protein